MVNFELELPTKIVFGDNVLPRLGTEAARYGKKALLVYGKSSIKASGVYDSVAASLGAAGIRIVEHPGVKPNPALSHAEAGAALAKRKRVDMIVAVGGGSVIDESKSIAVGAAHDRPLWDFFTRKAEISSALPLLVVQTLPATSSEINAAAVLTNEETHEKFSIRSVHIYPRVSFLDPGLTVTIPLKYTAYAVTDILSHMMEGYFTTTAKWIPVQDGIVEGMCTAVIDTMERLLSDPADYDARAAVMWAAALAWSGLPKAGVDGASIPNHMLEHPLSAYHDIAHGAGLSIVIPAWLRYKKADIAPRIIRFGRNILRMGVELDGPPRGSGFDVRSESEQADMVIDALENWYRKIGTPIRFDEGGIRDPDLEKLAGHALELARYWQVSGYTKEDIVKIYSLCGTASP